MSGNKICRRCWTSVLLFFVLFAFGALLTGCSEEPVSEDVMGELTAEDSDHREAVEITPDEEQADGIMSELKNDAVAVWYFDEGTFETLEGGEKVRDASGNENHGVMRYGVRWAKSDLPSAHGWALEFDGERKWPTYGYVEVPHSENLAFEKENFTIALWAYRGDESSGLLIGKGVPGTSTGAGYRLSFIDMERYQTVFGEPGLPGGALGRTSPRTCPAGDWYHIVQVFVHNGTDWSDSVLYINGELISESDTERGGSLHNEKPLRMGVNFKGKIASAAIFARSLTAEGKPFLRRGKNWMFNQVETRK